MRYRILTTVLFSLLFLLPVLAGAQDFRRYNPAAVAITGGTITGVTISGSGVGVGIGGSVTGGTASRILYEAAGPVLADSANLTFGAAAGQGVYIGAGTAATAVTGLNVTQTIGIAAGNAALATASPFGIQWTWNDVNAATGVKWVVTDTSSAASALPFQILGGAAGTTNLLSVTKVGNVQLADGAVGTPSLTFINASSDGFYLQNSRLAVAVNGSLFAKLDTGGLQVGSGLIIGWPYPTIDVAFSRISAGLLGVGTGLAGNTAGSIKLNAVQFADANGQIMAVQSLTELTTIAAAATTDTTIQMPAGAIVLAVDVRVTTVIPTATTFTVGDSGSAARFSTAAVSVAATSTDVGTKAGAYYNASALAVRITPNGTPADNTGRVRVTIHYIAVTPATS